jgi:hypothetical protein
MTMMMTTTTTRRRHGRLLASVLLSMVALLLSGGRNHASAALIITEFVAQNTAGLQDEDMDYEDWLEIYNDGATAATVAGLYLTDDAMELNKWQFPATVPAIAPNSYLLVFCSDKDRINGPQGQIHTSFALKASGEYLALTDGVNVIDEYAPTFPGQTANLSYGIDGSGNVGFFDTPTPGAANPLLANGFTAAPAPAPPGPDDDDKECWGKDIPILGLFFKLLCLIFGGY